ncbi:hypothetical protein ACH4ZU_27720 [Streptomyces sp. NPDC020472]
MGEGAVEDLLRAGRGGVDAAYDLRIVHQDAYAKELRPCPSW